MDLETVRSSIEKISDGYSLPVTNSLHTKNVAAQWVVVNPELARWLLDNTCEVIRKRRRNRVLYYRDAMENDEWDLNGDTFVIDCYGQAVNGQHRWEAIAESGIPQEGLFVYGVQPTVRSTTDDGLKRQFRDDLAMNGVTTPQYKDKLTRLIAQWDTFGGLANTGYRANRKHLAAVFAQNKDGIDRAGDTTVRWRHRWPGNINALTFVYWLLTERIGCDRRTVERFVSIIALGSQDPEDDVLVKLANRMKRASYVINSQMRHEPSNIEIYWVIRAWNYWVTNTRIERFMTPQGGISDPYPLPYLVEPAPAPEPVPEVIV